MSQDGQGALRAAARDLFQQALIAADPARALQKALIDAPFAQPAQGGRQIVVAFGKAAAAMMRAALPHLNDPLAILITNAENETQIPGVAVHIAGHPIPDLAGAEASLAVMAMLCGAGAKDRVIALISGGGSAMLPAPIAGISLAEKMQVSQTLLAGGFSITDMNLVRQHLSQLKGGGFLRIAAPAPVSAYILSDVIGDDLRVIASGPTAAPIGTRADAARLLRGVWNDLPRSVRAHLTRPAAVSGDFPAADNHLIGSNRQSLGAALAAAQGMGFRARIAQDALVGDVGDAAAEICAAAGAAEAGDCLIFGGETTVTLRGKGRGGRNQELALRVALSLADLDRDWAFLSGGTDGRDGPTDAAGGLVDGGTIARMGGADGARRLLADNASYDALQAAGDLLITGGTGTNVADVQILLIGPAP